MKKNSLIIIMFFLFTTDSIAQPLRHFTSMKVLTQQTAKALYEAAKAAPKSTPGDQVYALSMPLLASAIVDKDLYLHIDADMSALIDQVVPLEKRAWMLGRLMLAAKQSGDAEKANTYKQSLAQLIDSGTLPENALTAWAIGYLASFDVATYRAYRIDLFDYLQKMTLAFHQDNSSENLSNLLWTITMNVHAAASANHMNDYAKFAISFLASTQCPTLNNVMHEMPLADYRAWLLSINLNAAKILNVDYYIGQYQHLLQVTLENANTTPADRMLANANLLLTGEENHLTAILGRTLLAPPNNSTLPTPTDNRQNHDDTTRYAPH